MSLRESPITREFWQNELGGQGVLYEEFRAVEKQPGVRSRRDLDGVVVVGDPPEIRTRGGRCLDGQDIVIIQTKAAPLNPHVFGQALLSQDLIQMRWSPSSVRSVLLCSADNPDLRAVTNEFPGMEIHIRRGRRGSFGLRRLSADEVRRRWEDQAVGQALPQIREIYRRKHGKPFGQLLAPSSCPHGRRVMDSWKGRHLSALTAPNGRRRLFGRRIDHVRT